MDFYEPYEEVLKKNYSEIVHFQGLWYSMTLYGLKVAEREGFEPPGL